MVSTSENAPFIGFPSTPSKENTFGIVFSCITQDGEFSMVSQFKRFVALISRIQK